MITKDMSKVTVLIMHLDFRLSIMEHLENKWLVSYYRYNVSQGAPKISAVRNFITEFSNIC